MPGISLIESEARKISVRAVKRPGFFKRMLKAKDENGMRHRSFPFFAALFGAAFSGDAPLSFAPQKPVDLGFGERFRRLPYCEN